MINEEYLEAVLVEFQERITHHGHDRPVIVLVEGGGIAERSAVAERFRARIPAHSQTHSSFNVYLRKELQYARIDSSRNSFYRVAEIISNKIADNARQPLTRVVAFLYNYESVFKIDDLLRHYFPEREQVFAWVIVSQRLLSESQHLRGGGHFRGYHDDDNLGPVLVARLHRADTRSNKRREDTPKTVALTSDSLTPDMPPTRLQIEAALKAREGQAAFRAELMRVFEGRCAITSCTVDQLLEAAHIVPYHRGQNHEIGNGLILRADIHTLFDKGLLAIWPIKSRYTVWVAEVLRSDSTYRYLHGALIDLPLEATEVRRKALIDHLKDSYVLG